MKMCLQLASFVLGVFVHFKIWPSASMFSILTVTTSSPTKQSLLKLNVKSDNQILNDQIFGVQAALSYILDI